MKKIMLLFILLSFGELSFGQETEGIEKVKQIIEGYEPCNSVYCFEYGLEFDKENKSIILKSLRYNDDSNTGEKTLTETRVSVIPLSKIGGTIFFPGEEKSFTISLSERIEQELNGEKSQVDIIILDFNDEFEAKGLSSSLKQEFDAIVRANK